MRTLIYYLTLVLCLTKIASCQNTGKFFYGKWKIVELMSTEETNITEVKDACKGKTLIINKKELKINSSNCILQDFKGIEIEFESKLTLLQAKERFDERFLTHIFYNNKLEKIKIYKTNYKRKEDEGLGGENWIGKGDLHIIPISNQKIIFFVMDI